MARTKKVVPKWSEKGLELEQSGLEILNVYQCTEGCDLTEESPEGPLYECGECGTQFVKSNSANWNHQCPDCNKFGSRVADLGCDQCEEGEVEEVEAVRCPSCDELVLVDEWDTHLKDNPTCRETVEETMGKTKVEETKTSQEPEAPEPQSEVKPPKYPAPEGVKNFRPIDETDEEFAIAPSASGMFNLFKWNGTMYETVLTKRGKPEAWENITHAKESAVYRYKFATE